MRIWDIHPHKLCDRHLLGEHAELHAIWNILTKKKKGYKNHPETLRWVGKLNALYLRHEELVIEMQLRNKKHNSEIDKKLAIGKNTQDIFLQPLNIQSAILKNKNCSCRV